MPDSSQPVARKMTRVDSRGSCASSRAIAVAAATPEALSFAPGNVFAPDLALGQKSDPRGENGCRRAICQASKARGAVRCQRASCDGGRYQRGEDSQARRDRRVEEEPAPRRVEV